MLRPLWSTGGYTLKKLLLLWHFTLVLNSKDNDERMMGQFAFISKTLAYNPITKYFHCLLLISNFYYVTNGAAMFILRPSLLTFDKVTTYLNFNRASLFIPSSQNIFIICNHYQLLLLRHACFLLCSISSILESP